MTAKDRLVEHVMNLSETEAADALRFLEATEEKASSRPRRDVLRGLNRLFADSPAEDSTSAIRSAWDAR